jgi:hypothetical protein
MLPLRKVPNLRFCRSYWHFVSEDAIPSGTNSSRLSSVMTPGLKNKALRQYALAPLFGARQPAAFLGSTLAPAALIGFKPCIRELVDEILQLPRGTADLGLLHDIDAARLSIKSFPQKANLISSVELLFPDDWTLEEILVFGEELKVKASEQTERLAALGITEVLLPELESMPQFTSIAETIIEPEELQTADLEWRERVHVARDALRAINDEVEFEVVDLE